MGSCNLSRVTVIWCAELLEAFPRPPAGLAVHRHSPYCVEDAKRFCEAIGSKVVTKGHSAQLHCRGQIPPWDLHCFSPLAVRVRFAPR